MNTLKQAELLMSPPLKYAFQIRGWIRPEDISAAFSLAKLRISPPPSVLAKASEDANLVVQRLCTALYSLAIKDEIADIRQGLRRTAGQAKEFLECLCGFIPKVRTQKIGHSHLLGPFYRSRSPVGMALLNAAAATNPSDPEGEWSSIIAAVERAGEYADSAERAFPQANPVITASSRDFAWTLIRIFETISDRKPGFSRASPTSPNSGAVGGPLIRFLNHLFERLYDVLSEDEEFVDLLEHRSLKPSTETLASWITDYKKKK